MMEPLSQEFVDSCRVENGFRLRGEEMTRIEVFVDAAFAFAVTLLVISIDQIPKSVPELFEISKQIPAFVLSVAQLMWIWYVHSVWSKRFGLEDMQTIIMSTLLLIIVLIYIYPVKMLFGGFFDWITLGYLPGDMSLSSYSELRDLFMYFAAGFFAITLLFAWMYKHALNLKEPLRMSVEEAFHCRTRMYLILSTTVVTVVAFIAPLLIPENYMPFSGFAYMLIHVTYPYVRRRRKQQFEAMQKEA